MYSNPQIDWRDNFASFSMPPGTILFWYSHTDYYVWTLPWFTITSGSGTSTITVSINTGAAVGNGQKRYGTSINPCGNNNSKTVINGGSME
jgi:hypothetical protein